MARQRGLMTATPIDQPEAEGPGPMAKRLAFAAVIGAVYRIAFARHDGGDGDIFAGAAVRWTDFIAPILVVLAINAACEIFSDAELRSLMQLSLDGSVALPGLLLAEIGLRVAVGLGVTLALADNFAPVDRIGPGLLAYQWMQAALLAPWTVLARLATGQHPIWLEVAFALGMALAMIFCAARVMRAAFALPGLALGICIAWCGSIASFAVDRLIDW